MVTNNSLNMATWVAKTHRTYMACIIYFYTLMYSCWFWYHMYFLYTDSQMGPISTDTFPKEHLPFYIYQNTFLNFKNRNGFPRSWQRKIYPNILMCDTGLQIWHHNPMASRCRWCSAAGFWTSWKNAHGARSNNRCVQSSFEFRTHSSS